MNMSQKSIVTFRIPRKKVLIVNCYFDEMRASVSRSFKLPQSMAPVYLAGVLNPETCDLRLWNEQSSGHLTDRALLAWPDVLVLSGMTNAFDRMLQLTACVKTLNPAAVTIAGGSAIRALPVLAASYFDEVCIGDVEALREAIRSAIGSSYVGETFEPRFDLADWVRKSRFGYAESSRNCNFRCTFCTMTAENRPYRKLTLDDLRDQIVSQGRKDVLIFLDNNFYGNERAFFTSRMDLLKELHSEGWFKGWAALVTNDFFARDENLRLASESGCVALFSGIESFDMDWLRSQGKKQNTVLPQLELIQRCMSHNITFLYGMMQDVSTRSLQSLHDELEFILSQHAITLPSYISIPIPILNTPLFHSAVRENRLLPHVKLRDMDSTTLTMHTHDSLDATATYVRQLQSLEGLRGATLSHTLGFLRRHGMNMGWRQLGIALSNPVMLCVGNIVSTLSLRASRQARTHISTTERLDPCYTPPFPIDARWAHYYQPTYVTDERAALTEDMQELSDKTPQRTVAA